MNAISYSIAYTVLDTVSVSGLLAAPPAVPHIRQTPYRAVTLSPAAPAIVAPSAEAAPRWNDDFFETAFEGLIDMQSPAPGREEASDRYADQAPGPLRGYLEDCSPHRIAGWAQDLSRSATGVPVAIMLGRIVLAELIAQEWRADLSAASIGTGCYGFAFQPVPPIARDLLGAIKVVRVADKAELPRVFQLINQ